MAVSNKRAVAAHGPLTARPPAAGSRGPPAVCACRCLHRAQPHHHHPGQQRGAGRNIAVHPTRVRAPHDVAAACATSCSCVAQFVCGGRLPHGQAHSRVCAWRPAPWRRGDAGRLWWCARGGQSGVAGVCAGAWGGVRIVWRWWWGEGGVHRACVGCCQCGRHRCTGLTACGWVAHTCVCASCCKRPRTHTPGCRARTHGHAQRLRQS